MSASKGTFKVAILETVACCVANKSKTNDVFNPKFLVPYFDDLICSCHICYSYSMAQRQSRIG